MKRILYLLILMLIPINVFAESGTIKASSSSSKVTLNNTVSVTVKVSSTGKLGTWKFNISYDTKKLSLISGDTSVVGYGDGTYKEKSYTYKFKAIAEGTATINVENAQIGDWDSESKISTTASGISLTIKEAVVIKYSTDNNLKGLSVEGFELSKLFDKNTLEYDVTVLPTTEKVKINAEKNDSKASVSGAGEVSVQEGKNTFEIVVKAENGTTKSYIINVFVPEKEPIEYTFDGVTYNILRKLPEELRYSFVKSTIKFNNEEVECLQSETLGLTLIYLRKDNKDNLYIYDSSKDSVSIYNEIENNDLSIYILNKDFNVDGMIKTTIKINDIDVQAYHITDTSKYYVINAVNTSTNKENLYVYDDNNKTISLFNIGDYTYLKDETTFYKMLMVAFGAGDGILLIALTSSLCSKRKIKRKLREIKE